MTLDTVFKRLIHLRLNVPSWTRMHPLNRWVEFVTIIQSQTHKSYALGVDTLFSLFITKFWPGELVKLICPAILVRGL